VSARTIHPFPARMAPEIALSHLDSITDCTNHVVLDPMCGSGTVLASAAAKGISAIGSDLDPLALLISTVSVMTGDVGPLESAAVDLLGRSREHSSDVPEWFDKKTTEFANFWFGSCQRRALTAISEEIQRMPPEPLTLALKVALSRIIITKSPAASLAADTSHSRPHKTIRESDYDVRLGFMDSVRRLSRILAKRPAMIGSPEISLCDARQLAQKERSVDLVLTSPPYLNAIDYMRGHRLSLIWLGYTLDDLSSIRASSIGTERRQVWLEAARESLARVLAGQDATRLSIRNLENYASGLFEFAAEMGRVLKPGGKFVAVVGNSTVRGAYVSNTDLLIDGCREAGLIHQSTTKREIPAAHRYLPISSGALSRRMRFEDVVLFERAGE
jgi:hypothetical protein